MPIRRKVPALSLVPDWASAVYADPPSHDFCVWLVIAEMMRRQHGAAGPLRVRFLLMNGQLGLAEFGQHSLRSGRVNSCEVSRAYSDRMLEHVLRPAIAMMGAVEEPAVEISVDLAELGQAVEYDYHIGHLVDAGREGHKVPQWCPPAWAFEEVDRYLDGKRPVVITLRETDIQPERNSQVGEWLRFAESIKDDYSVLFLRDTCVAYAPLPFPTWPLASLNAYVRAALYQRALVNLMVCNGPNTWCIFSDAPYLIFKELVPSLPDWDHGNAKGWREQDHMEVGDQYGWASPLQRLTWTDDTFEEIRAAFDGFMVSSAVGLAA